MAGPVPVSRAAGQFDGELLCAKLLSGVDQGLKFPSLFYCSHFTPMRLHVIADASADVLEVITRPSTRVPTGILFVLSHRTARFRSQTHQQASKPPLQAAT